MREWFLNAEADIEDGGRLVGELTSRLYVYQADRVMRLESKSKMEHSPDEGDALSMTFAAGSGEVDVWF